jgi:hypothetical protein
MGVLLPAMPVKAAPPYHCHANPKLPLHPDQASTSSPIEKVLIKQNASTCWCHLLSCFLFDAGPTGRLLRRKWAPVRRLQTGFREEWILSRMTCWLTGRASAKPEKFTSHTSLTCSGWVQQQIPRKQPLSQSVGRVTVIGLSMTSNRRDAAAQAPLLSEDDRTYGSTDRPVQSPSSAERGTFTRSLTTLTAFSLVISIVIGSGVFTSPGAIDTNSPSPFLALATWLVGGLLAWTGAATLAELGTAIPGEGGVQPFLAYVFGDIWGFLAAWTWTVAVMPATFGILGIAFAETILLGLESDAEHAQLDDGAKGWWIRKGIAIAALLAITAANCISTKVSTRLNGFFVVTKFVAIAGVVVAGLAVVGMELNSNVGEGVGGHDWFERSWLRFRDTLNPDGSVTHWKELSTWDILGHLCAALYGALWAYSGWDKVSCAW